MIMATLADTGDIIKLNTEKWFDYNFEKTEHRCYGNLWKQQLINNQLFEKTCKIVDIQGNTGIEYYILDDGNMKHQIRKELLSPLLSFLISKHKFDKKLIIQPNTVVIIKDNYQKMQITKWADSIRLKPPECSLYNKWSDLRYCDKKIGIDFYGSDWFGYDYYKNRNWKCIKFLDSLLTK